MSKIAIIIPAYNEAVFIATTLNSLVHQTMAAHQIIVVDDGSSDHTQKIVADFAKTYHNISLIRTQSASKHEPGNKVIRAFYRGYQQLHPGYDILCKFDADLIFPENYLATLDAIFETNPNIGMASGLLHIRKGERWRYENIAKKTHIRGPIKAYRKSCFEAIGGLRQSIGWDTVDVLLATYYGWQTTTDPNLIVKHLKPTGKAYRKNAKYLQGEAMYKMRYGWGITAIAATKIALKKRNPKLLFDYLKGYFLAQKNGLSYVVNPMEGQFIRKQRWKGIWQSLRP